MMFMLVMLIMLTDSKYDCTRMSKLKAVAAAKCVWLGGGGQIWMF